MDTPQDPHPANNESGFARMLRDGNREPLARAKETLKDRLLAKVRQDVLDDFTDTEEVVEEVLKGPDPGTLDAVREASKQRLKEQLRYQVLHEVTEEGLKGEDVVEDVDLHAVKQAWKGLLLDRLRAEVLDELRQEALVDIAAFEDNPEAHDVLDAAKSAIKAQLMERLFRQAIAEIDQEVDLESIEMVDASLTDASTDKRERNTVDGTEDGLQDEKTEGEHATKQAMDLEAASVSVPAQEWADEDIEDGEEVDELLDMHFWEDEEGDQPRKASSSHSESDEKHDQEVGSDDPDFFLQEGPGLNGAPGSALEIAFDGEAGGEGPVDDGGWLHLDMKQPHTSEDEEDEAGEGARGAEATDDEPTVYYIYGVFSGPVEMLPDPLAEGGIVEGIPLLLVSHEQMHAIVSRVPATSFGEEALAERAEDTAWIEGVTQAHDEAVELFHGYDNFHALPAFTVQPDEESVQHLLAEVRRLDVLKRLEGRSEWCVVLYRNRETLHQRVVESSDTVQELMAEIKNASKGGASSIKKKMVAAIQEEMARMTDDCIGRVHEELLGHSEDIDLSVPDYNIDDEKGEVTHAATYLLHDDVAALFNDGIAKLRKAYTDLGFVLDVAGPRPPALLQQLQQQDQASG